jgi:glutaredoxin
MSDYPSAQIFVEIYSKPGCHLCDEAKEVLFKAKQEFGLEIKEVNIEEDDELFKKYRYDIPVIWINGRKAFKHRINEEQLRKRLENEKHLTRK